MAAADAGTRSAHRRDADLATASRLRLLAQAGGDLRADTGSGDVRVVASEGELDLDTGSGEVEVRDCAAGSAKGPTLTR